MHTATHAEVSPPPTPSKCFSWYKKEVFSHRECINCHSKLQENETAWCCKPKSNWIFLCMKCEDQKLTIEERIRDPSKWSNQSTPSKKSSSKQGSSNPPLFVSTNGTIHHLQPVVESPSHALSHMTVFPASRYGSCHVCQTLYSQGAIVQGYKVAHLPNDRWVIQCYPRCAKVELGMLTLDQNHPLVVQLSPRTPIDSPLRVHVDDRNKFDEVAEANSHQIDGIALQLDQMINEDGDEAQQEPKRQRTHIS